ncbi:hypothetical protein ACHAXT_001564 [Thalassiosira profunda]
MTPHDRQLTKPAAPVKILSVEDDVRQCVDAAPAAARSLSRPGSFRRLPSAGAESTGDVSSAAGTNSASGASRGHVDFVGPAKAVRHLFSLPYTTDRNVSVALHNVGNGTILLDAGEDVGPRVGDEGEGAARVANNRAKEGAREGSARRGRRRQRPPSWSIREEASYEDVSVSDEGGANKLQLAHQREERSLLASLSLLLEEEKRQDNLAGGDGNEAALTVPSNAIVSANKEDTAAFSVSEKGRCETDTFICTQTTNPNVDPNDPLGNELQPPQHYLDHAVSPPTEPRQYVDWKFHDMKLLVASDALIYGRNGETGEQSDGAGRANQSIAMKVADASELRSQMRYHEGSAKEGLLGDGRHRPALPPSSYVEALLTSPSNEETASEAEGEEGVTFQTCIVPASGVGPELAELGFSPSPSPPALVDDIAGNTATASGDAPPVGTESFDRQSSPSASHSSTPVCTVLDTYLDNIMTNVPQLALILREHGFVQNIKLLRTEDIPSLLLHPSTLGTDEDVPFAAEACPPIFSPDIVEMNAAMLLRFLKTNCTRENSTYLLHRAAGETNIQLFDISSISELKQRKWVWWLALCSYRFACRLEQVQTNAVDPRDRATRREYRSRQRSLLHNTLNLLEDLADLGGGRHETIAAAVCEHLADTYLWNDEAEGEVEARDPSKPTPCASSSQPYRSVTVDCLDKAHDHLINGIKKLAPLLAKATEDDAPIEIEAISTQLYGIHHKIVNVNLRLADHHLQSYFSSNLIQSLRTAARMLSDATSLLEPLGMFDWLSSDSSLYTRSILLQYAWLWEYCGHFARSFAADNLWRERGHTCGADLIGLFQEVNTSCDKITRRCFGRTAAPPRERKSHNTASGPTSADVGTASHGQVTLNSLSGIVVLPTDFEQIEASVLQKEGAHEAIGAAKTILNGKTQIKRDARQVLVAACVCYGHAIDSHVLLANEPGEEEESGHEKNATAKDSKEGSSNLITEPSPSGTTAVSLAPLLRKRLGDACNELGKILLDESRAVLSPQYNSSDKGVSAMAKQKPYGLSHVSAILLASAQFWFTEGLEQFVQGRDLRNLALLRCNLCQVCKIRANSNVILPGTDTPSPSKSKVSSEAYLQEAVDHLVAAHDAMGERESDPQTWDMVSEELAATLLVLGVRRRQSALSSSSEPLVFQAMRLTPGVEKSIVEPMERSCRIYESLGAPRASRQAAAAHYQLALYFSKVWTCQRDEAKTREKLAAAFRHYGAAHQYFYRNIRGNEATFVVLSLDFSGFYAAVNGEEALHKALLCCLDTREAFALPVESPAAMQQLTTLAENVEARVSKLLLNLVKLEKEKSGQGASNRYKDMYREVLAHKMKLSKNNDGKAPSFPIYELLSSLSQQLN